MMLRLALNAVIVTAILVAPVEAAKLRLTITSEPSGASIELNGQHIGTTPHEAEMEDWAFKEPKWLWSKFLNQEIRLRIWKEGHFPKELQLTAGPFVWTNMNATVTKIYYVITSPSFHVRLEPSRPVDPPSPAPSAPVSRMETKPTVVGGSGFLISRSGHVVTNFHVVEGAERIAVHFPNSDYTRQATVALKDETNDLAILQLSDFDSGSLPPGPLPFSLVQSGSVKMGQSTYTIGFPLSDVMGSTPRLSSGLISSLFGLRDDPRLLQISNPVQPGNSGGPLFNESGELVGIVVSGLNAQYFYENAGIIPQNINFAVKTAYLKSLIEMLPTGQELLKPVAGPLKGLALEKQIERVMPFVAQITSHLKHEQESEQRNAAAQSSTAAEPEPTVWMIYGGSVYHRQDCDGLGGHRKIEFPISKLPGWATPCSMCRPPARP